MRSSCRRQPRTGWSGGVSAARLTASSSRWSRSLETVFPSASPVVDHFLAALLGSPAGFTAHGLAAARAAFFKGGASKLLVEARFAAALTARGYATTPAAAHELQLCLPSHVAGTPRAAEAIAALTKVGLVCRKL